MQAQVVDFKDLIRLILVGIDVLDERIVHLAFCFELTITNES